MYTKCPGCNAEISFEPPANKNELPADYKHRIKCPACGVTIGVKINQSPVTLVPPTPASNNVPVSQPVAQQKPSGPSQIINVYHAPMAKEQTAKDKKAAKRAAKKSGRSRNLIMMIFSLVFVALSVVGYLIGKGVINLPDAFAWVAPSVYFDGISAWEMLIKNFDAFKAIFTSGEIKLIVVTIAPMALFTLAGIDFIVAFFSAIARKYGRVFNLILSAIIGASALLCFFTLFLAGLAGDDLGTYFKMIFNAKAYLLLAGGIWGVLQFVFSLIFLKTLKKKKKKKN